ncbi:hypothetical protein PENTCL1PPCAC_175, partial [Pristionchus entomophagus]
ISMLPDDCLISVISHLDRKTLETMEHVSQKMHRIIHHRCFKKPKKTVHEFKITQTHNGHALYSIPLEVTTSPSIYDTFD